MGIGGQRWGFEPQTSPANKPSTPPRRTEQRLGRNLAQGCNDPIQMHNRLIPLEAGTAVGINRVRKPSRHDKASIPWGDKTKTPLNKQTHVGTVDLMARAGSERRGRTGQQTNKQTNH